MIYDTLENSQDYCNIHPRLDRAFSFLLTTDLVALKPGRMELEGDSLYVLVQEYLTKPFSEGKWEAHQRYIDVQYIVSGVEGCGFASLKSMQVGEYDPQKDFQAMTGQGQILRLSAGYFAIFLPQDAHMPGLEDGDRSQVKKIVVKCKI